MEFTTKYWIIVIVLALILLAGTGALSVWICKIYDTEKPASLPPSVSPFPDVIPIVQPPTVDPAINNCYSWCSPGQQLPDGTTCTGKQISPDSLTTCDTTQDCQTKCSPPNSVTKPAVCLQNPYDSTKKVCSPQTQNCISKFPTTAGTDANDSTKTVQVADFSNLKTCLTNTDCNVCTDTLSGEQMTCTFVSNYSTVTLDSAQIQDVPQGYYCLPEKTGCDAKGGIATWTSTGWNCACKWPLVMGGPECNIMLACNNSELTEASKSLQRLLVNCNDATNPLCGQPWSPDTNIDPLACYDPTKGINTAMECTTHGALHNVVCQCDGTEALSNKGFTYDVNDPTVCVLDPCNNGSWGRTLTDDPGYMLNSIPGVMYSFKIVSPSSIAGQYLSLSSNLDLLTTSATADTKFLMEASGSGKEGQLTAHTLNQSVYTPVTSLTTNAAGSIVGADANTTIQNVTNDSKTWVLQPWLNFTKRVDNLDNFLLYNPTWNRPAGASFSSSLYNDKRYLNYPTNKTFLLGDKTDSGDLVILQRLDSVLATGAPTIPQPFTNCACSGANSVSSVPGCFDSNNKFVGITTLMNISDFGKCDDTYKRNISAVCDPYTIPNSVITLQPDPESKELCDDYKADLALLTYTGGTLISSTNLLPQKSGFVPGMGKFLNFMGNEIIESTCMADPCTGKYSDAAYSIQSNSGYWDALQGSCACVNGINNDTTKDYYPFQVDDLNQQWNTDCKPDPTKPDSDAYTSNACICDHITNPVCGVCQNACMRATPCTNNSSYPCLASNMSCQTDSLTGGPDCECLGNCMRMPDSSECMARIPSGGICTGLGMIPGVCQEADEVCMTMDKMVNRYFLGFLHKCEYLVDQSQNPLTVEMCVPASSDPYCWDSTSPLNDNPDYNTKCQGDGYVTCAIPATGATATNTAKNG
jgi:hypothetical protein